MEGIYKENIDEYNTDYNDNLSYNNDNLSYNNDNNIDKIIELSNDIFLDSYYSIMNDNNINFDLDLLHLKLRNLDIDKIIEKVLNFENADLFNILSIYVVRYHINKCKPYLKDIRYIIEDDHGFQILKNKTKFYNVYEHILYEHFLNMFNNGLDKNIITVNNTPLISLIYEYKNIMDLFLIDNVGRIKFNINNISNLELCSLLNYRYENEVIIKLYEKNKKRINEIIEIINLSNRFNNLKYYIPLIGIYR